MGILLQVEAEVGVELERGLEWVDLAIESDLLMKKLG